MKKIILFIGLSILLFGCQEDIPKDNDNAKDITLKIKNRSINEYSIPLNSSTMEIFIDKDSFSTAEKWNEFEIYRNSEKNELYYSNGLQFWMKIFNQMDLTELSTKQIDILIDENEKLENNIPCSQLYFKLLKTKTKTLSTDILIDKADAFKNKNLSKIEEINWNNMKLKKEKENELLQSYYTFIKRLTW